MQLSSDTTILIALALMLLVILFFLRTIIWKRNIKKQLGNASLINNLITNYSSLRYNIKFVLVISALALLIMSAVNLKKEVTQSDAQKNGFDMMIIFDASKSMLSKDVAPSRIQKAKQFANKLIRSVQDNRIGLVVFAGQPFLQMPVTTDLAAAGMYINNISVNDVPFEGTDIGAALQLSDSALSLHERKRKFIVLITDGEDQSSTAKKEADQLRSKGIVVFTIGVGTPEGSLIDDDGKLIKDKSGALVTSKLNKSLLTYIAQTTNGEYFSLDNEDAVADQIAKDVNGFNEDAAGKKSMLQSALADWIFLMPAFIFFIIETFIPEVNRKPVV